MPGAIKIELDDLGQLDNLPQRILEVAHEALETQAQLMKAYAQVFVLVDTGSLRDSIRLEEVPTQNPDYARAIRVRAGGYVTNPKTGKLVDYAVFVEAKSPFMSLAWDMVKDQIQAVLEEQVPGMLQGSE